METNAAKETDITIKDKTLFAVLIFISAITF